MRAEDFVTSNSGIIYNSLEGNKTFLPNPLPPTIDYSSLLESLGETSAIIGELRGTARKIKNPFMFVSPLQRREALTTSAMEGTHTDISQLVLAEEETPQTDENAIEAFNYVRALRFAIAEMQQLPISHRVIKEAHRWLLRGLSDARGASKRPGEYKIHQNWIGGGRNILNARYVPPPPEKTPECMDALEAYINREGGNFSTHLIDLALVHYQFEAIHPFADGNGRLGRMLVTLMALDERLLGHPLLYISPTLEDRKDEYIDLMHNVSTRGEWLPWIKFFLEIVKDSCEETIQKINQLSDLQQDFQQRILLIGRSLKLTAIIDELFKTPYLTIPTLEKKFDITYGAAKNLVDQLIQANVLKESGKVASGQTRNTKLFLAPEIITISDR